MLLRQLLPVLALGGLVLGCHDSAAPHAWGAGGDASAGASSGPAGSVVGTFAFTLTAASGNRPAYTSLLGRVYERAVPEAVAWTTTEQVADCRLLEPHIPFCNPGCEVGEVCAADDRCEPYPALVDVGVLEVVGLGADFDVKPIAGAYQLAGGKSLPSPPCAEGASFSITAGGGDAAAFTLAGRGIAALELMGPEQLPLGNGKALELSWSAPAAEAGPSRIELRIDVSHHGGSKGLIVCDFEDDGSGEVSADLVEALLALGTAGYPALRAQRIARTSADTAAFAMKLELLSPVDRGLDIDGVTSCADDRDCPNGTTCQPERACH